MNLALYVDGDYWHNLQNYKVRDARINYELVKNGYNVKRIWEHEINEDISKALSFLD